MKIDERLKEWATPRQLEFIDAVNAVGSVRGAAKKLNVHHGNIQDSLKGLRSRAAMHGYAPEADMHKVVPEPFVVRGTSTLYDELGNPKLQWVKTRLDDAKVEEAIRAAVEALSESVSREKPVCPPKATQGSLATLYTLTDCHVGMKAWAAETGDDWDLEIAEETLVSAFAHLVDSAPASDLGIVSQLGDFLHFDSLEAVTPQHRNLLDSDSRFPKVVQVAVRVLREVISLALKRHRKVIVSVQEGNHDLASSVWLRHLFSLLYEHEPRVSVLDVVTPYAVVQHGETMLCFHHGHLSRNESLPLLFAATFPQVWGSTKRRYCHTGHRHHAEEKEHNGMVVIQHPTLAARDAYAARGGWMADRSMTAITYHKRYGQVARATVVPEMLEGGEE